MRMFSLSTAKDKALYPEQFYINQEYAHFRMKPHQHQALEFNYIKEGVCHYLVGEKRYTLKKKQAILIDPAVPHRLEFDPTTPSTVVGIVLAKTEARMGTVSFEELVRFNSDLKALSMQFEENLILSDGQAIYPLLQEIIAECQDQQDFLYLNLLCNRLLIQVARQAKKNPATEHVQAVKDYIRDHYQKIQCVEEIAAAVGLHKTYLQRIFKEEVHCTIWQYLTRVRMQQATLLLHASDICIGEIDQHVGIHSRQNFYLLFRKEYGMSPKQYRKEAQQDNCTQQVFRLPLLDERTRTEKQEILQDALQLPPLRKEQSTHVLPPPNCFDAKSSCQ